MHLYDKHTLWMHFIKIQQQALLNMKVKNWSRSGLRDSTLTLMARLTADGGPLGQDGDGPHRRVLQLLDGAALGAPAVGADPQEVTDLLRSLGGVQDAPAFRPSNTELSLTHIRGCKADAGGTCP